MDRTCYRFERFELDLAARELRGPDGSIELERQVFDVLVYLVEHHDRVVPKSELLDEIWGDRFVSESALSSRIKSARRAIDDDGDRQRLIRTTRGVGFRFVGDVQAVRPEGIEDDRTVSSTVVEPVEPLIGRAAEASQLAASIGAHRLVTVIGPGGIGKTHLMRHVGAMTAAQFDDGAALVDLTTIADEGAVASTLARQLGAAQLADSTIEQSVLYHLGQKHLLLLIDNAEHVRAEVARLCAALLAACPNVSLIVTSRERLGIDGERLVPVAPLSIDDSIELFVGRASAHAVDVDREAAELRSLCERLDGIPLAIQLVASRTRMLSLTDIASRLGDHLAAHAIDSTDRHASMNRAIAWSFDSLDATDRRALGALSLLRGTFDIDDASAVIGEDGLSVVVRLAERSLIVPVTGTGSRFRMLEPIRLFASHEHRDRAATARYVAHFVAAAETANALLESDSIDRGATGFRECWPNIRGAFEEAVSCRDLASARRITIAASMFAELWLQVEVADWALTSAGGEHPVAGDDVDRAALLAVASRLLAHTGERERAAVLADALEQASPTPPVVQARLWSEWYRGDVAGLVEQLDLFASLVDSSRGATALAVRTLRLFAISISGTPDTSASAALRSLALRSGGTGHPLALLADGVDAFWERRFVDAVRSFDRSIEAAVEHGQMLLASGVATYRSIALASMIHDDRVVARLSAHLDAAVRTGERANTSGTSDALVVGNLGILADVTVAALALAVRGERTAAARALGVRHASGYHSYTTEWIAAMAVATLIEADREWFDREFDIGTGLDLERAARLTLDALRALDVQPVSADSAIGEKRRPAATP